MRTIFNRILTAFVAVVSVFAVPADAASPRNLTIQIRIDADNTLSRQGSDIRLGDSPARGRVYGSQGSGSTSSIQQVTVMEGAQAFINVGQSVVVPLHQILFSPLGAVVSDSVLIRDLGSGFYAKPTLKGDRVILEISAHQDTEIASPLDVNTTRISTTVAGRLGEWIRLGGSNQQDEDNRSGGGNYSTRSAASDRQIWLKVDGGP